METIKEKITPEKVYKRLIKIELKSDTLIQDNIKIVRRFSSAVYFLTLLMIINILLHIFDGIKL